jgi:alpha-maltose-1-phosphate synthase
MTAEAAAPGTPTPLRTLFVNSGMLGHSTVARLVRGVVAADPSISGVHIDLSLDLTTTERLIRRGLCVAPLASIGVRSNLDLARWRQELNAGLLAARRIRRLERAGQRFDVIHFHTQATAWGSLARMRRTPAVVSIDITQRLAALETASPLERATYAPNAARDRRVFRSAAAITATSRWAADDLADSVPECADRLHVLPYPVPLDGFDAGWPEARHRRAAEGGGTRFLFMGGDFPRKGGPSLLRAWRASSLAGGATLTIASDWPIPAATLPPNVSIVSGVRAYSPGWYALWRDADAFVLPTRGEAFGMVFQEAAAAGLPAIGTRINAVPEIVSDGRTGLLIPPDDEATLVDALLRLHGSPELRRTLGSAARASAETAASPAAYGERLRAILYSATGAGHVHAR